MSDQIRRIVAASIDGRAQNSYYIEPELKSLYHTLTSAEASIKKAIRNDSGDTPAEVDVQYHLALECVRTHYCSIDHHKDLDNEYSLAKGVDQPSRLDAVGTVYLIPSRHSVFYSSIAPLSAAIAAGNCVIIEIRQTISETNALLRRLLAKALSTDTFAVVDNRPEDTELFSGCVVLGDDEGDQSFSSPQLLCTSSLRVAAVVDRTSNVKEAACEVVRARLSFGGKSPYAPDFVLVNEFALKEFCSAAVQQVMNYSTEQVDAMANGSATRPTRKVETKDSQRALSEGDTEKLVSTSKGSLVIVRQRNSQWLNRKVSEPLLIIHAVSSLDDAIDMTNSGSGKTLLANYVFGDPAATKYLSQFIDARLCCANQIPVDLLVGPGSPSVSVSTIDSRTRFTKAIFSQPHPEFANASPRSRLLAQVLDGSKASKDGKEAWGKLLKEPQMPLPDRKRAEHANIGFFEQGLFTGVSVLGTTVVASAAVLGYWAVSTAMRRLR